MTADKLVPGDKVGAFTVKSIVKGKDYVLVTFTDGHEVIYRNKESVNL